LVKIQQSDHNGALETFNKALSIDPDDTYTLKCRGATKKILGDFDGALEDFNLADQNDSFVLR